MSNLKDLYISQSYFGIINLEDSTQPLVSQSGDINLQDGSGDNLGLKINASTNKFTIVNDLQVDGNADFNGNIDVSGSWIHTGSIDVLGNVTVEGNITAHTGSFDTVNTRVLHVTVESASVILSSGSNQIGDDITDIQTIVGVTTISGSLGVTGTQSNTGSLFVSNEISSSTINGIGNVTAYSASVDSRLDNAEWTGSNHETRIIALEQFTSSQESINNGYNAFTQSYYVDSASFDNRVTALENFSSSLVADFVTDTELSAALETVTSSLQTQIDTKLDTGSYDIDSASFDTRIGNSFSTVSYNNGTGQLTMLRENGGSQSATVSNVPALSSSIDTTINNLSSSVATTDFNQQNQIDSLIAETGSYAVTGSNTFDGNQVFSGSVQGELIPLTVTSQTASMDCSQGNFFTLTLPTGSNTNITATNIVPGLTITLEIKQPSVGTGNATFSTQTLSFPRLNQPVVTTQASAIDVATFVSFNSSKLNGVLSNDLV